MILDNIEDVILKIRSKLYESKIPLHNGYIGQCDAIRRNYEDGEEFWQYVMSNKKIIKRKEFELNVDTKSFPILDDDENWNDYILNFFQQWDDAYFAKSKYKGKEIYFLSTGGTNGFEWFWVK